MNQHSSLLSLSSSKKKKKNKTDKTKVNQSIKLDPIILEDTDDEDFDEMMSISFKKVNNTIDGREKCRPTVDSSILISKVMMVENKCKDNQKVQDTDLPLKSPRDDAITSTKMKTESFEISVNSQLKPHTVEKKRKVLPDCPSVLEIDKTKLKNATDCSTSPKVNSKNKASNDSSNPSAIKPAVAIAPNTDIVDGIPSSEPVHKKKKTTFQDQVLQHLLNSMKPFTLKTLAADLKTTDVALHNLMLSLVDKRIIHRKEFNSNKGGDGEKQKRTREIYWIDVDRATQVLQASSLTGIHSYSERDRQKAMDEKSRLLSEEAMIRKEILDLVNVVPIDAIRKKVEEEEQAVKSLKYRLDEIKNQQKSNKAVMKKQCPKTMQKKIVTLKNEWKKRKQQCMDFVENIADAMEKKKKDVIKDLQLELDDS